MKIVLVSPEIPPNTGSIARTCAGMRIPLHLIEPLGFSLDDRYMKRAGLDYWPHVDLHIHKNFDDFLATHGEGRLWFLTKKAARVYTKARFHSGDALVFGRETKGLDEALLAAHPAETRLQIPIIGQIRSYNLSNAVSTVLFEALRQTEPELFPPPEPE